MVICQFAACSSTATTYVNLRSQCGHTSQENMPVCSQHSLPGISPKTHVCPKCGQHVHMMRSPA